MKEMPPFRTAGRAARYEVSEEYAKGEEYYFRSVRESTDTEPDNSGERMFEVVVDEVERGQEAKYRVEAERLNRKEWTATLIDKELQ